MSNPNTKGAYGDTQPVTQMVAKVKPDPKGRQPGETTSEWVARIVG